MTTALVVLFGLQLGIEVDVTDDAVQRIATDGVNVVVIGTFAVDVGISGRRLPPRPPQQPAQSVKVGTGCGLEPETRGHRPEVELLVWRRRVGGRDVISE